MKLILPLKPTQLIIFLKIAHNSNETLKMRVRE